MPAPRLRGAFGTPRVAVSQLWVTGDMSESSLVFQGESSASSETLLAGGSPALPMAWDASFCPSCGKVGKGAICAADGQKAIRLIQPHSGATQVQSGQVLAGKYRIIEEIGHGGHGVVYRAEHLFGLGPVALKLLRHEDPDVEELRRFFREAQLTARLRSPHTATLYDVGQTESGALYMAMELLEGCTLEHWLRQLELEGQVLGEAEAMRVGTALLAGLADIHAVGLVHRDLKPANIAVSADLKVVKILDFGLARVIGSSLTPTASAVGTPQYMSPEQCSGQVADLRADLYALGVILYRCTTGSTPFRHADPLTAMWSHLHAPIPDLASNAPRPLSAQFCTVVHRALAKDPSRRFATAAQMAAALAGEELPVDALAATRPASWLPLGGDAAEITESQQAVFISSGQPREPSPRSALQKKGPRLALAAAVVALAWLLAAWLQAPVHYLPAKAAEPIVSDAISATPPPAVAAPVDPPAGRSSQAVPAATSPPVPGAAAPHFAAAPPVAKPAAKVARPHLTPRVKSQDPRLSHLP